LERGSKWPSGVDPELPFQLGRVNGREAEESGLRLKVAHLGLPSGCCASFTC
jgi:hypothetical protein